MNLKSYTNAELVDIHLIYGRAKVNERAAVGFYWERYPTMRQPNYQTFTPVYRNLTYHGSSRTPIESTGRPRTALTPHWKIAYCMLWTKILVTPSSCDEFIRDLLTNPLGESLG
ncbi:hypothetical protein TNCV_2668431 [Trichonephila clavipes]|nr:hypothetical protein TNCV_2668431 [Trichonephila clavipes]